MKPFVRDNLRPVLAGRRVLLGVSGSIAAFKACDIVRGLRDCGAEVRVVLTDNAQRFVAPLTLETLSGNAVLTSLWASEGRGTHHIETARWADIALVAPATANTIAKLALGLADDLLSTELLAFKGLQFIAAAMNPAMFEHPATQTHLATLASRGVHLLGPVSGETACGEEGPGRMLEPDDIVEAVALTIATDAAKHARDDGPTAPRRKMLITLGPTRSAIDPVRYVTNRSSGQMGAALAWAAARLGYEVVAVCGPSDAQLPSPVRRINVETAAQMRTAALEHWPSSDLFIAAAAVLDWDVANPSPRKLKKESGEIPALAFERNADILAELTAVRRPHQRVVGFAAETESPLANARAKLSSKGCDAIFVNDVSREGLGFESPRNAGWWLTRSPGETDAVAFSPQSKTELATKLMAMASMLFELPKDGVGHAETLAVPTQKETFDGPRLR